MTIAEFLEARLTSEELEASAAKAEYAHGGYGCYGPARVLAECAAKRAIIAEHAPVDYSGLGMASPNACSLCGADRGMHDWEWVEDSFPCPTLRALAAVYADHEDYRKGWAL